MRYYMAISASFDEPRKRKIRKNRKDQFSIVIVQSGEDGLTDVTNVYHQKVRYVPSYIYESIPISSVIQDTTHFDDETSLLHVITQFKIDNEFDLEEAIRILDEEYEQAV